MNINVSLAAVLAVEGRISPQAADYVEQKIGAALRKTELPVLHARVRVARHRDPAVRRPVVAQANIDLNGRQIRAHADGVSTREAVDRLEARLQRRLERATRRPSRRRGPVRHK